MKKRITAVILILAMLLSCAGSALMENPASEESAAAEVKPDIRTAIAGLKERNRNFRIPGSVVTFGSYEQDNDGSNGAEPIEWVVLETGNDQALLLSVCGLEAKQFNSQKGRTRWSKSSLRKWLNGTFLKKAFTKEEQAAILVTKVEDKSTRKTSKDRVFLLSSADASEYLAGSEYRLCRPTPSVLAGKNAPSVSEEGYAGWWLMNVIPKSSKAYAVTSTRLETAVKTTSADILVRPVIRVDLTKVPN